jgi:DNA-binding transcriptional MerR regulator
MSDKFVSLNDAASELTVSANTLKRWAKDFEQFLSPSSASNGVRRFTTEDVGILRRVKDQLSDGLSTDEVVEMFQSEGLGEPGSGSSTALATRDAPGTQAAGFVVLTDTLRAMIENQQAIQNSLQVNRNLQGVIIQDNFNLKEENMKLRERMQRVEQELEDQRKREVENRMTLEQRLAQLEREARKSILSKLF